MRRIIYPLIFIMTLLAVIVWQVPMAFALHRVDQELYGLQFEQAQGSIWNGRVNGLVIGVQTIGDVELKLRPAGLFKRQISYDITWRGPVGHGAGRVTIGKNYFSLRDLRSEFELSAIEGLSDNVRQIGGTAYLTAEDIIFRDARCQTAAGRVSTNLLSNAATRYGRDWPDLTGALNCQDGMLLIPLDARTSDGEIITVRIELGTVTPSFLEARITDADAELEAALAMLGFWLDNGAYVYRREAVLPRKVP